MSDEDQENGPVTILHGHWLERGPLLMVARVQVLKVVTR